MRKRSTELIVPFSGKILATMKSIEKSYFVMTLNSYENLYRKTKACVDVNGFLTDVVLYGFLTDVV